VVRIWRGGSIYPRTHAVDLQILLVQYRMGRSMPPRFQAVDSCVLYVAWNLRKMKGACCSASRRRRRPAELARSRHRRHRAQRGGDDGQTPRTGLLCSRVVALGAREMDD
jgi:hypothetical protein